MDPGSLIIRTPERVGGITMVHYAEIAPESLSKGIRGSAAPDDGMVIDFLLNSLE